MEYKKDFDTWNKSKKDIDKNKPLFFDEKEIWWCQLGVNIGSEEDGKGRNFERPILIIKKINDHVGWAFPLSSKRRQNKYRYDIPGTNNQVLLSQIRTIDSRRMLRRVNVLDHATFKKVIDTFVGLIKNETPLSG